MGTKILEDSIRVVSTSIVDSSVIFSKGKFDFYPNHEWTKGTTSSIESFVKIFNKFSTIFIKNKIENIKLFISAISESIKESSITLSLGKYDIYPKQEWTKGVSNRYKILY